MSKKANKKVVKGNKYLDEDIIAASIAVGISTETVERVRELRDRYKSWDLGAYMAMPPGVSTIYKVKRVMTILGEIPG